MAASRRSKGLPPRQAARAARLRYVSDDEPGLRRRRKGAGFVYLSSRGRPIRDADKLARIRTLAIPPAWTDVWICPSPRGHIQATGRDARGRKQYRYHDRWREVRDADKYSRMIDFGRALPKLRRRVRDDLRREGLSKERVLAIVVRLLETSSIRVGNDEYAVQNGSFGLTTLRNRHVDVARGAVTFHFRGKGGILHAVRLDDPRLAKLVKKCQDLPGQRLFQYRDETGRSVPVRSTDVNAYLREITGQEFTAKDFRTWTATLLAARRLKGQDLGESERARKQTILAAVTEVAQQLGHTVTICRKSYVHPGVIDAFLAGELCPPAVNGHINGTSRFTDRSLLQLLRRAARRGQGRGALQ